MNAPDNNPVWREIAPIRPRLRSHVVFQRQEVRGRLWYVLRDESSNRHFRLSEGAYLAASQMDGSRSMADIRALLVRRLGEDTAPGPDDLVRLLAQLHNADAVRHAEAPNISELWQRGASADRRTILMQLRSPLAIRIPLLDPDRFLDRTAIVGRAVFSLAGFFVWLGVILYAGTQIGSYWEPLTQNFSDRVLAADNLFLIVLVFPFLKALHELGHGYAIKRFGGECHEIGVMFLVFMPVPYVDASSAAFFPSKLHRVLVGAAGMYVELLIAALAFLLWRDMEPGLLRSAMYNIMLIGGVSTIFFNGNPLLRFDGYFILSDLISIPNLGPRSNRYIPYLIRRYIFRVKTATSPVLAEGERLWFAGYSVASFVYRMLIVVTIMLFVAGKFFFIGVILALWLCIMVFVKPVYQIVKWLLFSPDLAGRRNPALLASIVAAGGLGALAFAVPAPVATIADGVVWAAEEEELTFAVDGEVREVAIDRKDRLCEGCTVAALYDPELDARIKALESRKTALEMTRRAEQGTGQLVAASISEIELAHVKERLEQAYLRQAASTLKSPGEGPAILFDGPDLVGRYVRRGEILGYVFPEPDLVVEAVVTQSQIGRIREGVGQVSVALADNEWQVIDAQLERVTPASTRTLPSMALSTTGGGRIAIDPTSNPDRPQTMEDIYQIVVRLDAPLAVAHLGQRAHVRLAHAPEPVAFQIWRQIRQVFLRRFDV